MIDRRSLVRGGLSTLALAGFCPRIAFAAAPTARRFVFIIQRGAADGLHIVPPLGDPGFEALRGGFLPSLANATKLDDVFSLHPALARTAQLFGARQALAVHAVASSYRDRSHFDGQNILETGGLLPYAERSGWMNRLIALLPPDDNRALAYAPDVPMALRGGQPVSSYAPSHLTGPSTDLMSRVSQLYAADPQLHELWESFVATRRLAGEDGAAARPNEAAETGRVAAAMLSAPEGVRLMMIETGGWDTHSGQTGRLGAQLRNLDQMIGALADGLGPVWRETLVLVATEFGRTAAINGTQGTDHGTGSVALLLGGGLNGGPVPADWPGLAPGSLLDGRDLRPTGSLEAMTPGAVARHFGLEPGATARALYPAHVGLAPVSV
mgnify:CR=1 FL=1